MDSLKGTGIWVWYLPGTLSASGVDALPFRHVPERNGSPPPTDPAIHAHSFEWLQRLKSQGMDYVLVKAGDGFNRWNQYSRALVEACHAFGLRCLPWVYAYGDNPVAEAHLAAAVMEQGGDGLVLDVEYEYVGKLSQGEQYVDTLRALLPGTPIAYAPDFRIAFANRWPAGGWQPQNEPWPWAAFNTLDAVIPQLYWTDFAQTWQRTMQLATLWEEGLARMGWPSPPIYPLLPANGSPGDCAGAAYWAREQGMHGVSLWRLGSERAGSIEAVGQVEWPQEDDLSAEERAELEAWRGRKTYIETMLGTDDNPGGLVAQACGTMEAAVNDPDQDRAALGATVLGQCAGLRQEGGF